MKYFFSLLLSLFSFQLFAQKQVSPNEKQKILGYVFITHFIHEEYDKCWVYFDQELNPKVSEAAYTNYLSQLHKKLTTDNDLLQWVTTTEKNIQNRSNLSYQYAYEGEGADDFSFEVIFADVHTQKIAGFQPVPIKKQKKTNNFETQLMGRQLVELQNKEYQIEAIKLVQFKNHTGIVAVVLNYNYPELDDMQSWGQQEGLPIAKWIYKHPSYQKAIKLAKEKNIELLAQIGVSFKKSSNIPPFNVLIDEIKYK